MERRVPEDFEPGYIQMFDNNPVAPGKKCGPLGPTHAARIRWPDYEYQLDLYFSDAVEDYDVVYAECPTGRQWVREGKTLVPLKE